MKLSGQAVVAIDGSKFKAANSRDRNFSPGKIDGRQQQIKQSIQRYLDALETADAVRRCASSASSRPIAVDRTPMLSASYRL
ncbi:hypothetical protein WKW80_24165 [Variovorax humicola]|uniref:Transposase n=1 Tax=Variovorax humicola TaxID=1769758 RepID=A0ABU8W4U9_9BURK